MLNAHQLIKVSNLNSFSVYYEDCPRVTPLRNIPFTVILEAWKTPYLQLMIWLFKRQLWIKEKCFPGAESSTDAFIQECHYQSQRQDYTFIDCFSSSLHVVMILCPDLTSSSIISLCLKISMVNACDLQK